MEIIISLKVAGVHSWPECPHKEVAYLKDDHRHVFHIKVWKRVEHDERDIEIIMLKRNIEETLSYYYYDTVLRTHYFDTMSCEAIARKIYEEFNCTAVEVLEDGENGAMYGGWQ